MKFVFLVTLLSVFSFALAQTEENNPYKPGDRELFLCPTATTLPKDCSSVNCYDLVFLDFSFSPFNHIETGAFSLFPITKGCLKTTTVRTKWNYYTNNQLSSAAYYWWVPHTNAVILGNVASYKNDRTGLHLAPGVGMKLKSLSSLFVFMCGADYQLGENSKFLVEYLSVEAWDDDIVGFLTFGWRFTYRGEQKYIEFGGFRPMTNNDEDSELLFLPYIKVSWTWGL